jgi:glycosyltransferase involved in cell wall biosynthesis
MGGERGICFQQRMNCPQLVLQNAPTNMCGITVIIPVYRAELVLKELTRRLVATLQQVAGGSEIIFVEDCGGDEGQPEQAQSRATDIRRSDVDSGS